jgi:hypothetical protein
VTLGLLALGLGACAGTAPPPSRAAAEAPIAGPGEAPAPLYSDGDGDVAGTAAAPDEAATPAPDVCAARPGGDRLRRSSLVKTIDAGLGRWLQTVSVDPKVERGRFRGWIVRSLPAGDPCYAGVDLRADDVVVRVNGRSIERPEQAHELWVSLRSSPALVIDFLRAGQPRTLRFAIVDP